MNIKDRNWREIVEIVGVIGIVASILLLAMEVRQSNRIASSEIELEIAAGFNVENHERAFNPEYARLYAKILDPDSHLITATEQQQMRGLAWHYINMFYAAHRAHNNGLLTDETFQAYVDDMAGNVQRFRGLAPHYLAIREISPWINELSIFEPISELDPEHPTENQ